MIYYIPGYAYAPNEQELRDKVREAALKVTVAVDKQEHGYNRTTYHGRATGEITPLGVLHATAYAPFGGEVVLHEDGRFIATVFGSD